MRTRASALTTVTLFAVAVALLAFVAGRGGGPGLVKLPAGPLATGEAADAARSSLMAPAVGGVEYRLAGEAPALPSSAPAYRLRPTATAADVARLARAVGLGGEVREVDGAWAVRDGDRELRVERGAPAQPWYLGTVCEEAAGPDTAVASDAVMTAAGCEVTVSSVAGVAGSAGAEGCAGDAGCRPLPAVARPAVARAVAAPGAAPCPTDQPCPPTPAPVKCPPGGDCARALPTTAVAPAPCPPGAPCPTTVPLPTSASPTTVAPCPPDAGCLPPPPTEPAPAPLPAREPPARPADLPSRAEAERIARDAFAAMGVALDGFAVEDGWMTWEARVQPRAEGMEVLGLDWWLGVGPGGRIAHAGGFLASLEKIGDYPLAGADVGLRRLGEGYGGATRALPALQASVGAGTDDVAGASEAGSGPASAIAPTDAEVWDAERRDAERRDAVLRDRRAAAQAGGAVPPGAEPAVDLPSPVVDCADPTVSCAVPEPSPVVDCADPNVLCAAPEPAPAPLPEPVPVPLPEAVVVDVTGARVVLGHLDGVLVPSYLFELAGGGTSPPVPAVTDEWLDRQGLARPEEG